MKPSEELKNIKNKYFKGQVEVDKLHPSSYCKNTYAYSLGECARCGMCGRKFDENGDVIEEATDEL